MKKLLISTAALTVSAPAFANDVTLSGTFAASYTTGNATITAFSIPTAVSLTAAVPATTPTTITAGMLVFADAATYKMFQNGEGAVDTLTLKVSVDGDGYGGALTLSPLESDLVGGYNIFADTQFGRFSIGTNDGISTDEDFAEVGAVADETFDPVGNGMVESIFSDFGVDDGPVDDLAGVENSASAPSLSYKSPDISGLSFGITWGSTSAAENYILNVGYSSDLITANVDVNGAGDYRIDAKIATGVGNILIEYGFGQDANGAPALPGLLMGSSNDNYELRFETRLGNVGAAIGYNSDGTVAVEGGVKTDAGTFAAEYTQFGDDALINVGPFGAHNNGDAAGDVVLDPLYATAQALGGGAVYGVKYTTDIAGIGMELKYEAVEIDSDVEDVVTLTATLNEYVTVSLNDNEELTVGLKTSF